MDISKRLLKIAEMVDTCNTVADIGTDHGYIPIYLIENNICSNAIASDINSGPLKKAKFNIEMEELEDKIQVRLGSGLSVLKKDEAQCIVIAGMGGNTIKDMLEERREIIKNTKSIVLQPVQNPEVVRKYVYEKGFCILDEDLCFDENKYYEIIKIAYGDSQTLVDSIYYEIGKCLIEKKHPLLKNYIMKKINSYEKILDNIKEETTMAIKRKDEIAEKLVKMKGILKCI